MEVKLRKILMRMSKMGIYVLILIQSVTMVLATESDAQRRSLSEITIDLGQQEASSLIDLVDVIESKSNFTFAYLERSLKKREIHLKQSYWHMDELLKEISIQARVSLRRVNESIAIINAEANDHLPDLIEKVDVQQTITGTVKDESGLPLPGATVLEKGTTNGTTTDISGRFQLSASEDAVLIVSFVGYETQEILVNSQSVINVEMAVDSEQLEEVVVIGYGTVKKSDLTGAVSTLKPEEMNPGVISSVDQAFKGRIAGVQVSQTSAEPGGGLSVRIRGVNSITAGNEPLYVIDGLPINNLDMLQSGGAAFVSNNPNQKNPLNSLNPNDIQSIEVLKDASATAIYGARGANGVVLITTKDGEGGKLSVNFDNYLGVQSAIKKLDVLSTSEYIETMNTLAEERGDSPVFSGSDITEIGGGTDWQDQILRDAKVASSNLSISGGNDRSKYFASFNYFDQEGIVRGSDIKRYTVRLNSEQKLTEKLTFGINASYSHIKDNNNVDGTGINETAGPLNASFQYDPTLTPRQPDGSFTVSDELTLNNPLAILSAIASASETDRVFGTSFLNYKLFNGLSAEFKVGMDRQTVRRDIYNARGTIWGTAGGGQADVMMLQRSSQLIQYTMNYNKDWTGVSLNAVIGTTYENFVNSSFGSSVSDFPTDVLGTNNLQLGNSENALVRSNKSENSLNSYLARANLTFWDKLLLTASFRADGSSRFGVNNKWAYFPSAAVAYKLGGESFIPSTISELKIRTSIGKTGNQEIGNYASKSTFSTDDYAFLGGQAVIGTVPSRIPNPDLKWEETTQIDIGLDIGFLDDRITGSLDYFIKNTNDMLMNFPLPTSTGFGSILKNIGSMRNTGFEAMITSRNVVTNNFQWTTTGIFSAIRNSVTDIGGLDEISTGNIFASNIGIIREGEPLNAYYTYKVLGMFQDQEEVDASAQPSSAPGNPIYFDADGDSTITADDRVIVGNPFPDFTFGFRNSFKFKDLELEVFIDGQHGADLLNGNAVESLYPVNERRNRIKEQIDDRWTINNRDARWPSALDPASYGGSKVNSLVIEDASYIRIQSVRISYTFRPNNLGTLNMIRLYATAQNLAIFSNYSGVNPEANAYGKSNIKADYSSYPLSRTFILGLNLSF